MEASRRQPAYESGHARGGSQQATASRREQEASRRKSAGGRWMPAGDSQQARENRQANQREQEASRRKSAGGRRMLAGDSQQARERTDKLDRCGSQQATASRREKEASRWKPAGGRWKPAGDSQQQHHQQQPQTSQQFGSSPEISAIGAPSRNAMPPMKACNCCGSAMKFIPIWFCSQRPCGGDDCDDMECSWALQRYWDKLNGKGKGDYDQITAAGDHGQMTGKVEEALELKSWV